LLGTIIPIPCEGCGNAEPLSETSGDEDDAETCRKYLPAIGSVVPVPCEGSRNLDAVNDVEAPKQVCDQLAGDAVDFIALKESRVGAVSGPSLRSDMLRQ